MFNPYHTFTPATWEACLQSKTPYLVTQTFKRAFSTYRKSDPTCVLITPYTSFPEAMQHRQAREKDPLAAMLRMNNPKHVSAVERLLDSGTDYTPYWSGIPQETALLDRYMIQWEPVVRQYIAEYTGVHHTTSQPTILHLEQRFGELSIRISYKTQDWYILLEDVEKEGLLTQ